MITAGDKKALKEFGENLRKLRKEKGLSLREMSYACSIDNSKIAKIEKGMINITLTTLLQLAVALETHPSSLLDYELK
jgi:transcriptional regulator with XRE-family HTH domain